MLERVLPDGFLGISKRPIFVDLVLKQVGIDRARRDAKTLSPLLDRGGIFEPIGKVPRDMQSDARARARDPMDLSGVTEFLFGSGSRGGLQIFSKARSGVGETPGGQLDTELIESRQDFFRQF